MHNPAMQHLSIEATHGEGDDTESTDYLERSHSARIVSDPSSADIECMFEARVDPGAFKIVYERYFDRIYSYCLRRVGQKEDAEDITSVVFVQALKGVSSY